MGFFAQNTSGVRSSLSSVFPLMLREKDPELHVKHCCNLSEGYETGFHLSLSNYTCANGPYFRSPEERRGDKNGTHPLQLKQQNNPDQITSQND